MVSTAIILFCTCAAFVAGFIDSIAGGGGLITIPALLLSGLPLAIEHCVLGAVLCITIIGIPFGMQHFKLAKLALMPFGAEIY